MMGTIRSDGEAGVPVHDFADSFPPVAARPPEKLVLHHLGMPAGVALAEPLVRHLEDMRGCFEAKAVPWASACRRKVEQIGDEELVLEGGITLRSDVLAAGFKETDTRIAVVTVLSAGEEVDQEIDRLWKEERPDEAMFLNACAIAFVEHLRDDGQRRLAEFYASEGLRVLPHYSPGYEGWQLEDQKELWAALEDPGPVRVLESGGLQPAKSTLALFGVTRQPLPDEQGALFWDRLVRRADITHGKPEYAFAKRTLEKWRSKRLSLTGLSAGRIRATFRTSGSTCANMGLPLAFDYHVELQRQEFGGYRIETCRCEPAPGETNHRSTCLFLTNPAAFEAGMKESPPLGGKLLDEALHWNPDVSPAGCLCLGSSRDHKWKVVFQTIHHALANPGRQPDLQP